MEVTGTGLVLESSGADQATLGRSMGQGQSLGTSISKGQQEVGEPMKTKKPERKENDSYNPKSNNNS